jgi:sugar phosphate permease
MVGATEVIVGNAEVELAGVASGLQSTALQVGGTIGTSVLGAVMSAKVDSLLPARWAAAHLPALSAGNLAALKSLTTVGDAPVQKGIPPQVQATITDVVHSTFLSGMTASFLVASVVAIVGALIALLTKKGHSPATH